MAFLDEIERDVILCALWQHRGNRTTVSQELGINRKTLFNKINLYREEGELVPDPSWFDVKPSQAECLETVRRLQHALTTLQAKYDFMVSSAHHYANERDLLLKRLQK
jgi:hypothetical protein